MKLVLRVIGRDSFWKDLENPFNSVPSKGDYIVFEQEQYVVAYLEYDYDSGTVYLVCKKN